jgi:hypothetical protein
MDLTVKFRVIETGSEVTKKFDSYIKCRNFVNKLRYSKKCILISYPYFNE